MIQSIVEEITRIVETEFKQFVDGQKQFVFADMALCYAKQIQQKLSLDSEKFNIVDGLIQSLKNNIQAHCQVPDTQTILCNLQSYLNTEFGKTFQK